MFNKKIKFYCSLPEVQEKYPIIRSRDYNFNWMKDSAREYKKDLKENSISHHVNGTVKCTGIHAVLNQGYILRSWFDLTIKTTDEPYKFEFIIPQEILSYLQERNYTKELITWFSGEDLRLKVPVPDRALQTLIKIITPWAVSIPKGWSLMILPIPYPDETALTSTHGILESGDFYEINPIIIWNKMNSKTIIKAGTPLCQLIPISNNTIEVENLPYNEEIKKQELKWKYNICHKFIRDYN